jgi:hypothetical protein
MTQHPEEPPPILRTWARLYTAVALYLCALIALFALFTRSFNR